MQLALDIRRDGIPTLRTTTCVRDLRKLGADEGTHIERTRRA